jgi:hypothetical protein
LKTHAREGDRAKIEIRAVAAQFWETNSGRSCISMEGTYWGWGKVCLRWWGARLKTHAREGDRAKIEIRAVRFWETNSGRSCISKTERSRLGFWKCIAGGVYFASGDCGRAGINRGWGTGGAGSCGRGGRDGSGYTVENHLISSAHLTPPLGEVLGGAVVLWCGWCRCLFSSKERNGGRFYSPGYTSLASSHTYYP